jgi:hypothetical protein
MPAHVLKENETGIEMYTWGLHPITRLCDGGTLTPAGIKFRDFLYEPGHWGTEPIAESDTLGGRGPD